MWDDFFLSLGAPCGLICVSTSLFRSITHWVTYTIDPYGNSGSILAMFHYFFGISRLIIIHLIHLSALALCVCLMFSCSPHLQEQPRMPAAQPQHIKKNTEKKKHHTRWTIRGPVMLEAPTDPTIYLPRNWLIDIAAAVAHPGNWYAEMLAINFPVPNRGTHSVKTKKSFQVEKVSRGSRTDLRIYYYIP